MAEASASGVTYVNTCPFCGKKLDVDSDLRRHLEDIHQITVKTLAQKNARSVELMPMPCKTTNGKLSIIRAKLKVLKSILNENFDLYLEQLRHWIHCDITRLEFDTNVRTFFTRETIMSHHDFIVMFLKEIQMISRTFRKSPIIYSNSTSTPIIPAYLNFPSKTSISSVFPSASTYSNPVMKPPLSAQLNLTSKPLVSTHSNLVSKPSSSNNSYAVSKPSTSNHSYAASKPSSSNHLYASSKPSTSNPLYASPKSSTSNHLYATATNSNHLYAAASKSSTLNHLYAATSKPSTSNHLYAAASNPSVSNHLYTVAKPSTSNQLYSATNPSTSNHSHSTTKPSTSTRFNPALKPTLSNLNLGSKEKLSDSNLKNNNHLTNEGIGMPNATFMPGATGGITSDDTSIKNSETLYALSIVSSWKNECANLQKKEFSKRIIKNIFDHIEQRRESIRVRPDGTIYDTRKTDPKEVTPNDPPKYTGDVTLPEILDTLLANPQLIPRKNMYDKAIRTIMKSMEKGEIEIPASSEEENV
ncbi:c2H2-type domain-containing protein [Nephila pilipes]|uniref:C2H2-type domain-containing protein n=1 Tax=Nephila pilipes TaxID=299642 RepID=A0A8X6MF67_NEPPI|nr:c2H2-type domain-containing protein [Nephila pilipes]